MEQGEEGTVRLSTLISNCLMDSSRLSIETNVLLQSSSTRLCDMECLGEDTLRSLSQLLPGI